MVQSRTPGTLTSEGIQFLHRKDIAVLSTTNKKGDVHGAVVYYVADQDHTLHILTKADTAKARDILTNEKVAITIFDAAKAQTLQLQGKARIETDESVKRHVFDSVMKPHKYNGG